MSVISWTEIVSFHNIYKYANSHPEILNGNPVVQYRAKVKLHGTNGAVQVHNDGSLTVQSRTTELVPGKDNDGFAKWVYDNQKAWKNAEPNMIYFGEWCGPGVQQGVAVSNIP